MNVKTILDKKKGNAFVHLEEKFWIEMLTASLEKTKGNVLEVCRILGISKNTVVKRCAMHGVDPNTYRTEALRVRKTQAEDHAYWKYIITRAFSKTKNTSEAARNLGWNRTTLQRRMSVIGFKAK